MIEKGAINIAISFEKKSEIIKKPEWILGHNQFVTPVNIHGQS
jgi:hypothetical protein